MSSVEEAAEWDKEFKFNSRGLTLIDGDRLGTNKWFDGAQTASMVLKPGFVIHSVNPKDFITAIQAALDES